MAVEQLSDADVRLVCEKIDRIRAELAEWAAVGLPNGRGARAAKRRLDMLKKFLRDDLELRKKILRKKRKCDRVFGIKEVENPGESISFHDWYCHYRGQGLTHQGARELAAASAGKQIDRVWREYLL